MGKEAKRWAKSNLNPDKWVDVIENIVSKNTVVKATKKVNKANEVGGTVDTKITKRVKKTNEADTTKTENAIKVNKKVKNIEIAKPTK
jgi:membrane-bound lytic murein transglycosylase MltF